MFTKSWDATVGSTPLNAHIDNHTAILGHESSLGMAFRRASRYVLSGTNGGTTRLNVVGVITLLNCSGFDIWHACSCFLDLAACLYGGRSSSPARARVPHAVGSQHLAPKHTSPVLVLLFTTASSSSHHITSPFALALATRHFGTHPCPSVKTLALHPHYQPFANAHLFRQSNSNAPAIIRGSMAGPNDKAFRSMLRSSKIKKVCAQNATSNYERDIKTMSGLAGDMARGMKISKRASWKKRAVCIEE